MLYLLDQRGHLDLALVLTKVSFPNARIGWLPIKKKTVQEIRLIVVFLLFFVALIKYP